MAAPLSNLFNRTLFWVSSYVTQRAALKELIKNNGGLVVINPKDADIRLVNPDKRGHDVFLDTYSYKWVERTLEKGQLEPFEPYRVGPSAPRPMGASYIAKKVTRTGFTLKDDQLLFDWVAAYRKITGAEGSGNGVYQELEKYYPQHPWQSWRTRYVKKIRGNPRPGGGEPRPIEELHPVVQSRQEPAASIEEPQPEAASSGYAKRKRDSAPGPSSAFPNVADPAPSPKRISLGTALITATPTTREAPHEVCGTRPRSPSLVIPSPRNYHPHLSQPAATHTTQSSHAVEAATTQSKPPSNDPAMSAAFLLELPFFPSPSEPEEDDEETADEDEDIDDEEWSDIHDLNSWIDSRIARRGVDESEVINALRRTSMNPIIADKVLKLVAAGQDVPTDMRGLWTAEDDQCLEGGDKYGVERVLKKHGDEAVTARWEYLSMARDKGRV